MKPEHAFLVQATLAGGACAVLAALLARSLGNDDIAHLSPWFVLPGACAALLATALTLHGWRKASAAWTANKLAAFIVLHLLWILPILIGGAIMLSSFGQVSPQDARGVGGEGFVVVMAMLVTLGVVGSAVAWGLPAYLLALLGSRTFLARKARAREQVA